MSRASSTTTLICFSCRDTSSRASKNCFGWSDWCRICPFSCDKYCSYHLQNKTTRWREGKTGAWDGRAKSNVRKSSSQFSALALETMTFELGKNKNTSVFWLPKKVYYNSLYPVSIVEATRTEKDKLFNRFFKYKSFLKARNRLFTQFTSVFNVKFIYFVATKIAIFGFSASLLLSPMIYSCFVSSFELVFFETLVQMISFWNRPPDQGKEMFL